jgi:hypothetical protein
VEYLHGNGIVVMTSGGGGGELADEVICSAGTVYNFPDFKSIEHSVVDVPASTLRSYAGTYGPLRLLSQRRSECDGDQQPLG